MSEDAFIVVEISVPAEAARQRAAAVTRWLLDTGIIEPNPDRDELMRPSEYRAGPKVLDVAPDFADVQDLANNGVDVICDRQLHHPIEAYEHPPACPKCGTLLDEEIHWDLIEPWLAGPEPSVTCAACGASASIGDWPCGESVFQVGNLAVRFNNWTQMSDRFLAELGSRLGPRWRVVYEHS